MNAAHHDRKSSSLSAAPVILLTGRPGIGKTTAIRQVVNALGRRAGGFYTREVRAADRRTGFELVTLDGKTALLATKEPGVTFDRPAPFGRYRVNLDAIDAVGLPALLDALDQGQVGANGDPVPLFSLERTGTSIQATTCWGSRAGNTGFPVLNIVYECSAQTAPRAPGYQDSSGKAVCRYTPIF